MRRVSFVLAALYGNLLWPVLGSMIGVAILFFAANAATSVPALDRAMRPVIAFGYQSGKSWQAPVQNVSRDRDRVCWTLYVEKLSPARLLGVEYKVNGGDLSASIPTAAYLVNDDSSPSANQVLPTHPVGDKWHQRYCFDVADRIPDFRSITIRGVVHHDRWPHLWTVDTPTPVFTVGPMR